MSCGKGVSAMLEGAVMEYAKWFIGMLSIMFIIVLVVFLFRLNEVNSFQQEVNYQVERHGGLTEDAKVALDDHARQSYGGCIAETPDDNAPCLFPKNADDTVSSGFFVNEVKTVEAEDGTPMKQYYNRPNDAQARYGTKIEYVITRQIGDGSLMAIMKPSVFGSSASRVRGTAGD